MPAELSWATDPRTFALAGLISFAIWVVRAVARGTLVPSRTVEQREQDWAARAAQREQDWAARLAESREREDVWRTAYGTSEENVKALSGLVEKLTVQGETTLALLRALPKRNETT